MAFPEHRLRRLRRHRGLRALVQEHAWSASDLVQPLFVAEPGVALGPVPHMPGVARHDEADLIAQARACYEAGLNMVALFPVIHPDHKTPEGREALNPDGLIPRVVRALKQACPDLMIMTDVALDPYTSHGQDGWVDAQGQIMNDATNAQLAQQAVCQAQAGVDVVAPSDMMDGRIGVIRQALDASGCDQTAILAYSAKYASSFYGPFRQAVGSSACLGKADKATYQMNPANVAEALHEVALDLEEGADMVMIKPGLPYLDVVHRVKEAFQKPTAVYQVSGEYAMLQMAVDQGLLPPEAIEETLLAFKRAGADLIITYFALAMAQKCAPSQPR